MAKYSEITYDELINNYEFKVSKKIIMKEFPFVKDIMIENPEDINKYSLIFLDFVVDPVELRDYFDEPLASYLKYYLSQGRRYRSPYLSALFEEPNIEKFSMIMFDNLFEQVADSPAIPSELKLPPNRKLRVGTIIVPSGSYDITYP